MVDFGMAEIVPFPERKPVEGSFQTVTLDELLQVLARHKKPADIEWERRWKAELSALMGMDVAALRDLWDRFPDDGSHTVDGYDLDLVHRALNAKGDGHYCAV